ASAALVAALAAALAGARVLASTALLAGLVVSFGGHAERRTGRQTRGNRAHDLREIATLHEGLLLEASRTFPKEATESRFCFSRSRKCNSLSAFIGRGCAMHAPRIQRPGRTSLVLERLERRCTRFASRNQRVAATPNANAFTRRYRNSWPS